MSKPEIHNTEDAFNWIVGIYDMGRSTRNRQSITGERYVEIGLDGLIDDGADSLFITGSSVGSATGSGVASVDECWGAFVDSMSKYMDGKDPKTHKVYFKVPPELSSGTNTGWDDDISLLQNGLVPEPPSPYHRIYCRVLISDQPPRPELYGIKDWIRV